MIGRRLSAFVNLNDDDIRMAKELGFQPRTLIKNIPSRHQGWKAPVKDWLRGLYEQKFGSRNGAVVPPREEPPDNFIILEDSEPEEDDYAEEYEGYGEVYQNFGPGDVHQQNRRMIGRQEDLFTAATYVADEFLKLPEVQSVGVFGSVVAPLEKEIPPVSRFRRNRTAVYHECADVDMIVWMTDLSNLKALQTARGNALNRLLAEEEIGIPHFQVDVHILEPRTHRYRGRLCNYGECPKHSKDACMVDGCGVQPFLRQIEGYKFQRLEFLADRNVHILRPIVEDEDVPF